MRRISVFAAVALALCVVGASATQAGDFYVGGSLGTTSSDLGGTVNPGPGFTGTTDDSDMGFKVMGGYTIMKFLAVEAAFVDVGQVSMETTVPTPAAVTAEADGFTIEALGIFPFANKWEAFAKAGLYLWDGSATITGGITPTTQGSDGTDPTFGLGVGWNAFNRGQIRFEAERYTLDDMDVDMFSAGFNFRF